MRKSFLWAMNLIPDLSLYIFFVCIHQRVLISLPNCSQVTHILHCRSVFPVICLVLKIKSNVLFFEFSLVLCIMIWETACFVPISRTLVIISSPPPTPFLPPCCHSSPLFLSFLLLPQLSDDNSLLGASCCRRAEWDPARSQLTWCWKEQRRPCFACGLTDGISSPAWPC